MTFPKEYTLALTQPTVCALIGFHDLQEALKLVPDKQIPFVMLLARDRQVLYAQDYVNDKEPHFILTYARTLKLRVFVMCDRFTDLSPSHISCVSHLVCASSMCAAITPQPSLLWLKMDTMAFEFV
jgi:hypothetical protein